MAVKKLGDLTIEEATKELKKRGLDVNGDRNMLIARLRKALTEQRKPQAASASPDSNLTEKTLPSPTVDRQAPAAGAAETVSQAPAASSTEEKLPQAEVAGSTVQPQHEVKEGGGEPTAEEKIAEDPPLDLLADESQNDLDDDIVCVSMTPGRGFPMIEGSGQKQVLKDSPGKTPPSKDTNIGSSSGGTTEPDDSKKDLGLWVSGLDSTSRAADLKMLFSNYGKVTGAKVVASAKAPGSKCFGIITMATPEDVEKCIEALDGSTLNDKTITVELYAGHRKTVEKAMVTPATATLWISGISPDTKAPELKKLFIPHGKVVAATIVMNASGGSSKRCGLVKMSSCEEADLCIQKVNKATLDGRVITVERAKTNTLPTAKSAGKAVNRQPPALMSQKLPGGKPSGSRPLSLMDPLLGAKGNASKPDSDRPRGDRMRMRRGTRGGSFGRGGRGMGGQMGRRSSILPPSGRMRMEIREREMMRLQHEQQVKAKEAELVRVLALEFDRQKQKEESERLAYEREQLEVERMRLERERMDAERLRVQLEQERRQNEREQLERERARNQMLRNEQRMNMKRAADQEDSYYDYLMKKGRASSPSQSSGQGFGRGPVMYENTSQRLQQMAHGAERRINESRMKNNSIPSGSSSSMGGRQMQGSSMYRQSSDMDSSRDSGSKSEWKSLFNMSSGNSVNNNGGEQSQWKSLSSSSLGHNLDDHQFSSGPSYRGRPYSSGGSGFGGMKSQYGTGFKGGRGGGGGAGTGGFKGGRGGGGGAGGGAYRWR